MIINLKKYVIDLFYKYKQKIEVDTDFYESNFYLIDMED